MMLKQLFPSFFLEIARSEYKELGSGAYAFFLVSEII